MKKLFLSMCSALGVLMMITASCTPEEAVGPQDGAVSLQVTSGVEALRAYDNAWEEGDAIGLFATSLQATNVKYTTSAAGTSVDFATDASVMIPMGNETHQVQAYYPYAEGVTRGVTVALPAQKPLLYAQGSVTNAQPKLSLIFKHQLAEIKVTVDGSALDITAAGTAQLKGVTTGATLTAADGTLAGNGTTGDVALFPLGEFDATAKTFVLHGFLLPGEKLTSKELVLTVGDLTYTIALADGTTTDNIVAGKSYHYKYKLTTGGVVPSVEDNTIEGPTVEPIEGGNVNPDSSTTEEPGTGTEEPGTGTEEPGTGTEEPGTGTEEPAGPVALFAGSDFENFEAFEASLGDPLKYAVQSTDGGRDGSSALHISGTPTRNDYVFTATVGEGVDAEKLANPTAITFYLKGKVSGKSISLNVHLSDGSYKPFNLGTVTGETTEITVEAESQNSYTGSITLADWTKITLSLDDLKLNTTAGGDLFALKVGKTGVYDIYIDDIMIE